MFSISGINWGITLQLGNMINEVTDNQNPVEAPAGQETNLCPSGNYNFRMDTP